MKCDKTIKCSINRIADIMGSKWNIAIVWHLRSGALRFTALQSRICNVNSKTITTHLRDLEKYEIITRKVYPEVPPRVEYTLTEKGDALIPIIEAMLEWGGKHLPPECRTTGEGK